MVYFLRVALLIVGVGAMKMRFIVLLFFINAMDASEWHYSKASADAQQENWKEAQTAFSKLLVQDPENSSLLYDAGVAAYRLKEFEKAAAYFSSVADKTDDMQLKEQAYFNGANAQVGLKQLEQALQNYEQALAINPENERTKYNRDKVKEMLEQQKQQEQQKQDQKQQEDQKKDKQHNENDSQQKDNAEQNGEKNNQNEQNQHGENQQNKPQDGSQQSEENEKESKQNESAQSQEQKQQQADDQHDGERKDQSNDKSDSQNANDKQDQFSGNHNNPSSQNASQQKEKAASNHTKQGEKEQGMQVGKEPEEDFREQEMAALEKNLPKHEKWMAAALQQLEKAEEKEQKKMIKAQVARQAVGQHEQQNDW